MQPMFVRFPAFVAGVLLIPLTYQVSYRMYHSRTGALLAASFVMAWPALIDYSVNARGYSLLVFFTMILVWLVHLLKTRSNLIQWLLFIVTLVLGFYTIPVMLFPAGMVALWLFLSIIVENHGKQRKRLLMHFVMAMIASGLLIILVYTPVLIGSGLDSLIGNGYVASLPPSVFYSQVPGILQGIIRYINWGMPTSIAALGLFFVVVATVCHKRMATHQILWVLAAILWIVPLILIKRSVLFARTWLFLIPLYLTLAAAGLNYVVRWLYQRLNLRPARPSYVNVAIVLVGILLAGQVVASNVVAEHTETGRGDAAGAAARYLNDILESDDLFVASSPTNFLVFYYATANKFYRVIDLFVWNEGNSEKVHHTMGYVYFMAHTEAEFERIVTGLGDIVYEAEVVHEFPSATLMRLPRNQIPVE
ncbi:hypothetical protein ACFLYO_09705 [Chloroflexota bacterium]